MHLYSAFIVYCHTPKVLYNHVGGSLLNHHQCAASTWMMRRQPQDNGASALTTHQLQWRGERDRANQVDGDYWEAMIDKGQWREIGQDTGVTPLLFTRSAMGFLMTTESQDLGFNVSSERRIYIRLYIYIYTGFCPTVPFDQHISITFPLHFFKRFTG